MIIEKIETVKNLETGETQTKKTIVVSNDVIVVRAGDGKELDALIPETKVYLKAKDVEDTSLIVPPHIKQIDKLSKQQRHFASEVQDYLTLNKVNSLNTRSGGNIRVLTTKNVRTLLYLYSKIGKDKVSYTRNEIITLKKEHTTLSDLIKLGLVLHTVAEVKKNKVHYLELNPAVSDTVFRAFNK